MSTDSALGDCEVFNRHGEPHRLGDMWRERPVLLVFVRHFGCIFCSEQVGQMRRLSPQVHAAGASWIIVGNGSVEEVATFAESLGGEVAVYSDPTLRAYDVAGAKRNLLRLQVIANAWRAYRAGHRQRRLQGSPTQHGAVLLVLPGGRVAWRYVSRTAGDHPTDANILSALSQV